MSKEYSFTPKANTNKKRQRDTYSVPLSPNEDSDVDLPQYPPRAPKKKLKYSAPNQFSNPCSQNSRPFFRRSCSNDNGHSNSSCTGVHSGNLPSKRKSSGSSMDLCQTASVSAIENSNSSSFDFEESDDELALESPLKNIFPRTMPTPKLNHGVLNNKLLTKTSPKKSVSKSSRPTKIFSLDDINGLESDGSRSESSSLKDLVQKNTQAKKFSYDNSHSFSIGDPGKKPKLKKVSKPVNVIEISDSDSNDKVSDTLLVRPTKKMRELVRPSSFTDSAVEKSDASLVSSPEKANGVSRIPSPRIIWDGEKDLRRFSKQQLVNKKIKNSPLKDLRNDTEGYDTSSNSSSSIASSDEEDLASTPKLKQRLWGDVDNRVLQELNVTRATPLIRALESGLFGQHIMPAESKNSVMKSNFDITCDPEKARARRNAAWEAVESNAEEIRFEGNVFWCEPTTKTSVYGAAVIRGVTYKPGDCVIIRPSESVARSKVRPLDSENDNNEIEIDDSEATTSDLPWFGRIVYIFENEFQEKLFHVRWFFHGAETTIGEIAGPNELFISSPLNDKACDDNSLACIDGKIDVSFVGPSKKGHAQGVRELDFTEKNKFFYRFEFDEEFGGKGITDPTKLKPPADDSPLYCGCCEAKIERKATSIPKIVSIDSNGMPRGLKYQDTKYYVGDLVFLHPREDKLLEIGQIYEMRLMRVNLASSEIRELFVRIRYFKRTAIRDEAWYQSILDGRGQTVVDERLLILTRETEWVKPLYLEGKCEVRHLSQIANLDDYKDHPDAFYVKEKEAERRNDHVNTEPLDPDEIRCSVETENEFALANQKMEFFKANGQKHKAIELFAGIGGLSTGMHMSGSVQTEFAVEYAPTAAATFKRNSPQTTVYNEDVNACLARAVQQEEVFYTDSRERDIFEFPIKKMPNQGDVSIIMGGFPCQGVSGANQALKCDDLNNTLILPLLSFVDIYRYPYVLLENVIGLLRYRLGAQQEKKNKTIGGIEKGMIKFIIRTLTCMGYQVKYTVLQAGEYGVPQSRQRLIIWAALAGYTLPDFPQATHVFNGLCPDSGHRIRTSTAPHAEITVADAISDLPQFEWINPHNIIKESQTDIKERLHRASTIEQVKINLVQNHAGRNQQRYQSKPLVEFQRRLRQKVTNGILHNHVTPSWFDSPTWGGKNKGLRRARTEQVCSVPLRTGADHRDLPQELKSWSLYHPNSAAQRNKYYPGRIGRLLIDQPLRTCMTTIDPASKNGQVLHPFLHRVLSVREYARAMGFPDCFTFEMINRAELAYHGLGNAVPPLLAEAIGRELTKVLVEKCWEDHQR